MQNNTDKSFVVYVDEDLKTLIPKFIAKQKLQLEKIKMAMEKTDYVELKNLGHQMKGSCGGYGFVELGNLGGQIEKFAETHSCQDLFKIISDIEVCLSNLKIEYKK